MRYGVLSAICFFMAISTVNAQQSSAGSAKLEEAITQARAWYAGLPLEERQKVDARYKEYEEFMKKHSDEMNERMNKVEMNERMIYVDRQNEEMKKRRANIKP